MTIKFLARALVLAVAFAATTSNAQAVVILTFGQTSDANTIAATVNGSNTQTTITGTNVAVTISQIENGGTNLSGFLNLTATSTNAASNVSGNVIQDFSGSFTITSLAGGLGINYLSGTFTDGVFGLIGGASLTLSGAQPPGTVSFTSSVITSLAVPRGISFSFANVSPGAGIVGTTLGAFTSSVSGTFSGSSTPGVPEPATMIAALIGIGGLGIANLRRRKTVA